MKIAIVGFDREGRATYEFFKDQGHEITVCDQNEQIELPGDVNTKLGGTYLDDLDTFDLIVRTPGLHPAQILKKNPGVSNKITSGTNLFFENCPTKNVIGITGTKGKGTTSTLVRKMLEAGGKDVHLLGNIGTPMLNALEDITSDSWVILELSNFQLIDMHHSPHIAAVLMITHEHLDWHEDFEEYIAAKQQLFIHQNQDDIAIYYADNKDSLSIADATEGSLVPYCKKPGAVVNNNKIMIGDMVICDVADIKLVGQHNWQNVCAAVTIAWQITQNVDAIKSAISNFSGLPFRIEFRREVNGIRYYNDSFATGPGAAIAAIKSIPGHKVLIIGGYDRMLDLTELVNTITENAASIRKVVLIGASVERTAEALRAHKYTNFTFCKATTMPEIVTAATVEAEPGDAVVLSPSFASFDLFKNFEDRGNQFNEAVAAL